MKSDLGLREKKCDCCGKTFFLTPDIWVYKKEFAINHKRPMKYFCSWGCLRKYEKAREK